MINYKQITENLHRIMFFKSIIVAMINMLNEEFKMNTIDRYRLAFTLVNITHYLLIFSIIINK
jgi:hypothetical protein